MVAFLVLVPHFCRAGQIAMTTELSQVQKEVLIRHPRAIFHLRAQFSRRKLMPVFGAGVGRALDLPNWDELINRISTHPNVNGALLNAERGSNTSRTQMLFQHFRGHVLLNEIEEDHVIASSVVVRERLVRAKWSSIIRECLYETARDASTHPYMPSFLQVIRRAPLTVNYNFDDCIEDLLDADQHGHDPDRKPYETVWEPTVQYRHDDGVIYHPNGFLPRQIQRGSSPWLVFADDAFADQMIDAQRGHYSTLLSHFFRFTGLLVGLSLDDPTLRHLLRQSAQVNPGHVHYYVAYSDPAHPPHALRAQASRESNFETYNLVTLFLSSEEIAALGVLIAMPDALFGMHAEELGLPKSYVYFLSGAVGAGKTTCIGHFKCLTTFDEWLEPKPASLFKAADALEEGERLQIDTWIDKQFSRKNILINRASNKVCVVDRSLIDPIAFSPKDQWQERAKKLKDLYATSSGNGLVANGMVLLLTGNPQVMHSRILQRHKGGSFNYVDELQQSFIKLWSATSCPGVRTIDTMDRNVEEVVKAVSRIIHLEDYMAERIDDVLARIADFSLAEGEDD